MKASARNAVRVGAAMAQRHRRHVLVLLLGCLCASVHAGQSVDPLAAPLPELEVYPGARSSWVARRMSMNGLPMTVRAFSSDDSPADVLRFYRRYWKGRGLARTGESAFKEFQTAGAELNGFYFSVQVRAAGGGTEGVLVVSASLQGATADKQTNFPLLAGDAVLEKIEAFDLGVRSETLVLQSGRSVSDRAAAYRGRLLADGWRVQRFGSTVPSGNAPLLQFQKGLQHCQLAFLRVRDPEHSGTRILIHWIKSQ